MTDRLDAMIQEQYIQQRGFIGSDDVSDEERLRLWTELGLGLIGELHEFMELTGYNTLLPRANRIRDRRAARLYQLVDMMKYLLSLAHLDGISAEELYTTFIAKTDVVRLRYREEISALKVVAFDIDGVVCDLAGAGFDPGASEAIKAEFFDRGEAAFCAAIPGAAAGLCCLQDQGYGILLVTTRKRHWHPKIEAQTYAWLRLNNIPFDRVIFTQSKADALADTRLPISWYVEDSPKHAIDVAKSGIRTFYVGVEPLPAIHENIILAESAEVFWGMELFKREQAVERDKR